jgi:ABC-2 type transport system ATP-binding protein
VQDLVAALEREGLAVDPGPDGAITVETPDTARVGDIAFAAGVVLHELSSQATSLEEAFLALTTDQPELTA